MADQSYASHRHPPRPTLVGTVLWLAAIIAFALRWFGIGGRWTMAAGLAAVLGTELVLLLISRTYTTALQDRIIRLEMRVRTASLLAPPQQALLWSLTTPQIVALRFASDAELPMLVERAAREHLSADQIKRAIVSWVPDVYRT